MYFGAHLRHHPLGQAEVARMADQATIQLDDIRRQRFEAIQIAAMATEIVDGDAVAPLPVLAIAPASRGELSKPSSVTSSTTRSGVKPQRDNTASNTCP